MNEDQTLKVLTPERARQELGLPDPANLAVSSQGTAELDKQAADFVEKLLNYDAEAVQAQEDRKASVETMGLELQRKAAHQSEMLKAPIKTLSERGSEGGPVANALIDLKMQVESLDPAKFDFEPGWGSRMLGMLPGVGTPLKKYFSKYECAQTTIAAIVRSLEQGRDQLQRDNVTLTEDQKQMREMTKKLEKAIQLGQAMDAKIQYKLEREIPQTDAKHGFVQEQLLFPLRQRILDLQQQLAVNQQGVLAVEVIIRNNKELMRGVDRALSVTISALQTAVTVALSLAHQKIVLDKIDAVNKTTSNLISGTAERLRTQGVAIQKQASSTQIDMEALKSAFTNIQGAIEDVSNFRKAALPQMANTVLELDQLTARTEKAIQEMEKGNRAKPTIQIEVE